MTHAQTITMLGLLALFVANHALARAHAPQVDTQKDDGFKDQYILPQASYLKALGLNHDAFTSSMVWIAGLLYYGDYRVSPMTPQSEPPKYLKDYAQTMIAIDPLYTQPYDWFASTYLISRRGVTNQDLEHINELMDVAIERFPTKSIYPYNAGMHYIGYSVGRDPETRIKELEKGIMYLEKAAQFGDVPEEVPFTVGYMYRLKGSLERKLKGEKSNAQEDAQSQQQFYIDLYKTTADVALRGRLRKKLIAVGVSEEAIQKMKPANQDRLEAQYARKRSYLPINLWMLTEFFEDLP